MPDKGKKLLIIDGHSILNRAFYGLPDLTNYEGLHTNAVLGFLNILFKITDEEKPTNVCVAFDVHQPTFRHEMFKEYKGTRHAMPDELREQVPLIKEVLQTMNVAMLEKGGYEADDIIGTLSRRADADGYRVVIVSGDRDLLQLATDNILVRIPKTKAGGTTVENYYAKDVEALYGVTPTQFIDMKGLMGDTSDNIPGVPGIGEKTAAKIIHTFGSIENALNHIDEIKPPRAQKNLAEFSEQAFMSKELATIKLDCELDIKLDDTDFSDIFNDASYNMFKRLGFNSLLGKFDEKPEAKELKPETVLINEATELDDLAHRAISAGKIGLYAIAAKCGQTGGANTLLGAAIALGAEAVYVVNCISGVSEAELADGISRIKDAGTHICVMDLKQTLGTFAFEEKDTNVTDAGVAAYLINPLEESYNYDDLSKKYLRVILPSEKELTGKDELNAFTFISESFLEVYSYKAVVPLLTEDILQKRLTEMGMDRLYFDVELPTVYTLHDMERRGIRVDRQALDEYSKSLEKRICELHDSIIGYAGREFNINSPKQLGPVLFEEMALPGGKKTKTGYSTSVDVLEKIKNVHPIINDILEYRQLTKLNSTYAVGLANYISEDGRIHGVFNQTITATGRISSTEPNLQNIPMRLELGRLIRKAFIPRDGYVFVDADYSQVELRVLAHLSGDKVMQKAFLDGVDIHATTASEVFGVPIDEVTPLQRRHAKAVNFGIVYGISAFGLSEDLGISRKEAAEFIDRYYETYQSIKTYLDEQVENAKKNGYVKTMFGRVRPIPELKSSNFMQRSFGERVAMNSPIQGTAADIIKIAMMRVNMKLKSLGLKSRLILQIHDELLIETAVDEVDTVKELLTEEMMNAAQMDVPLLVQATSGKDWYEAK